MEEIKTLGNNKAFNSSNDFTVAFFNIQMQYALALYYSWSKAVMSSSNLYETTGEKLQEKFRSIFDKELGSILKKKKFSKSLSDFITSYSDFAIKIRHDHLHRFLENLANNFDQMIEPIRDTVNRTPSEIITLKGKFDVHHYKTDSTKKFKTPILIVGSLINRHYILDLLPETSVIRYFQQLGFDVYATDWRIPTRKDENMSLERYARDYLKNAVDKIEEITGSRNIILFGYCWGGILALIYSALYPANVKSLILHATPTDFGHSPTVLESWIKDLDVKKFVKTFGNVPSSFLNIAFWLRNPLEAILKYQIYFRQARSPKEIKQFLAVESWLYDSVPIIGKAFEQIINDIYKKNLLIQNKLKLGERVIDLKKLTMPVLNIVGINDDLVSPVSSRTITNVISSNDKKTIEFPSGHVGLCVSRSAHKKLWPEVGQWITEHSD